MPFASLESPALGISLLKARLGQAGISCDVAYPGLAFAEILSAPAYERIARLSTGFLAGEWVFSGCLFGCDVERKRDYLEVLFRLSLADRDLIAAARAAAPRFLDEVLAIYPWGAYGLIGFGSSCEQNIASLALAGSLKERYPSTTIAFGGANWEGVMGETMARQFPFVDVAFLGEADDSLPAVVRMLETGTIEDLEAVPGIAYRSASGVHVTAIAAPFHDLDDLPSPDFSDFFRQLADAALSERPEPVRLCLQSSRGCWWAEHHACRFCGLNGSVRAYRAQSPERTVTGLREIAGRWPDCSILLVDTVVPRSFLREVLPVLAEEPLGVPMVIEVRPDLSREQVGLLAKAGIAIQVGIESLSERILALTGKGTHVLECLRLLRWCKELGVTPYWNIIIEVPGETREDYEEALRILPALRSLDPPVMCTPMYLDRFSEYYAHQEDYGLMDVKPLTAWRCVYPLPEEIVTGLAGNFLWRRDDSLSLSAIRRRLRAEVTAWQAGAGLLGLRFVSSSSEATIVETRAGSPARVVSLDPLERSLCTACDNIATREELLELGTRHLDTATFSSERIAAQVDRGLERLMDESVLVGIGGRYLSLVATAPGG